MLIDDGKSANGEETRLLYNLDEVARLMSVSVKTVRKLCKCGELPSIHIGRRRLVARRDLLKALGLD